VKTLEVGKSNAGAKRVVALRLRPDEVPKLLEGDALSAVAELQVTTRCDVGQTAAGCGYNPNVAAQIILTGNADDTNPDGAGSRALSDVKKMTCTAAEHHCMFTFGPGDARAQLTGGFDLPCVATDSCHVNLVAWAWHPDARTNGADKVIVGANEGNYLANGEVEGDRARLAVIRERGVDPDDRHERETKGGGDVTVPTTAQSVLAYSHPLKAGGAGLVAGEHFVFEAKLVVETAGRVRFSALAFLTKDPGAKDGDGLDKTFPVQIGEHNGINCTPGTSPCTLKKAGVFRVDEDIDAPVYLNVVVRSEVPGGGSTNVRLERGDGWVRTTRVDASLDD
jgi:hypothetical protein